MRSARHSSVTAVADADLVDAGEEVVGRVPGEDVGEAGLHAHPDQRQAAGVEPAPGRGELIVTELHAGDGERRFRVGL